MPANKGKTKTAAGLLIALAAGAAATAALLLLCSALLSSGRLPYSAADEAVIAVNFLGAVLTGALAARGLGREGVVRGVIAGAALLIVLLLGGLIFGGGLSAPQILRLAICTIGGSLFGGVLFRHAGNKKLHKKAKVKR